LTENIWESEDGPTAIGLCAQDDWDQPMCWIDNRTLAAWGEDNDSDAEWQFGVNRFVHATLTLE
jgi:hypothetical protein